MMAVLVKLMPLLLMAFVAIYCGVFFISGQLLPSLLGGIYAATGLMGRTFIAVIIFTFLGNLLVGYSYAHFSPALVTPASVVATIAVQIAMTVLILGIKPSPMLIPASLVVIAGCVWVNLLLQK